MSAVTQRPSRSAGLAATAPRLALLAILLLAFALRAYHLDFQSLWSDEGISLLRAGAPLAEMLRDMPVEHTPGYFVLLHGWLQLTGTEDFALRYLSLLPSVLAVALIFRLGIDLGLHAQPRVRSGLPPGLGWVAAAAALLLATNGFQIWYAQEARMYAWLLAAGLFSSWSLWRLLHAEVRHSWPWALLYAVSTASVVYLHLYGSLLPLTQAVFVTGWALTTRNWRTCAVWVAAALAALLLFAPWLPHALGILGFNGWREGGDAAEIPWRFWSAYTVSDGQAEPWRTWLPWLYGLLAVAGAVYWWRTQRSAALFLALQLLLPLGAVYALALRNPDYHERYTIFVTAPLMLLVAGALGLVALGFRRQSVDRLRPAGRYWAIGAAVLLLGLLVAGNGLALQRLYADSSLHKPDYRAAAARIADNLQPSDVVLVDGPDPRKVFLHYYRGAAPVYDVSGMERAALQDVGAKLSRLTQGADRAWELLFFHNPAAVQVWLATQAWATEPTEHNGLRVTLYGLAAGDPVTKTLDVNFGDALTLQRAEVSTPAPKPGDLLRVSTDWFVHAPAPEYKFSLRLTDSTGNLIHSVDYVPQNWFAPTSVWVVGQPARDQRGLLLPADLPPGRYALTLRLYDPATGAAVNTAAGQDVLLAELNLGGAP